MSNTIKERPVDPIFAELAQIGVKPNGPLWEYFRTLIPSTDKTLTQKGEIQPLAPIKGRTEGLGTTVQGLASTGDINATTKVVGRTEGLGTTTANLDATGKLTSTDAIAADGTGSPLTGGKRGFAALDTNNRLANTRRNTAVNVSAIPTSSTSLSNDGIATAVTVAAVTVQMGDGTLSYNAGSFDPGVGGIVSNIFASDPTYAGGVVAFQGSTTPPNLASGEGTFNFGRIKTLIGTATTGGGYNGGAAGGGAGGRGFAAQ